MPEAPQPQPHLEVVGGEGSEPAPQPEAPARSLPWLLALLLLVFAVALLVQTRRVGQLAGRVESLDTQLGSARAEVAAYESQLGRVRGLVDDLGARFEELRAAVSSEPGGAAPPPDPAP